jgi:hypothetical protein
MTGQKAGRRAIIFAIVAASLIMTWQTLTASQQSARWYSEHPTERQHVLDQCDQEKHEQVTAAECVTAFVGQVKQELSQ